MPSVQATVGRNGSISPVTNASLGTRVVIVDGQYVNKINFNITANNNMGVGWDATHPNNNTVSVGGAYTGTKTIYDASWGETLQDGYSAVRLHYPNQQGSYFSNTTQSSPPDVQRRFGNPSIGVQDFELRHQIDNATSNEVQIIGSNLPLPTFRVSVPDSRVLGTAINTDIPYDSWSSDPLGSGLPKFAKGKITINARPDIGDQLLHVQSNTTPYQYYTNGGEDEWFLLKQPNAYTRLDLIHSNDVANEMGSMGNINSTGTYYVKVLMYTSQWGSVSEMNCGFNITGNRAQYMSLQSGTVSNFRAVTGQTGLAVGYSPPITITSSNLSGYDYTTIKITGLIPYSGVPTSPQNDGRYVDYHTTQLGHYA